jgi:hypothetical protein
VRPEVSGLQGKGQGGIVMWYIFSDVRVAKASPALRKLWMKAGHKNPLVLAVAFQVIACWTSITMVSLLFGWLTGSLFNAPAGTEISLFTKIWLISMGFCTVAMFTFLFLQQGNYFALDRITLSRTLKIEPDELSAMAESDLVAKAMTELKSFGRALVNVERTHGLYSPELVTAKAQFEQAYKICREFGLIEDVGYGKFIPKLTETS